MSLRTRDYHDTINYLYNLRRQGIKLGLSNTKALMSLLGNPHRFFNSIHIAGTNGKGSTASMITSILLRSGLRVGTYTSPHLVSFTERIRVNGQMINEDDVIRLTSTLNELIKDTDIRPTFFEFITAMAFYYFMENGVEWAVIETGMGGRFDATNVIEPEVSIITNVGLDHMDFLGKTISDITAEKAGIIKNRIPLITGVSHPDSIRIVSETAKRLRSEVHIYGRDFNGTLLSMDEKGIRFDYHGYKTLHNLSLPLAGRYQLHNASIAIRACEVLNKKEVFISDSSIIDGLKDTRIEGRFEIVSRDPFIIIDGAHNPEAMKRLCETITELFTTRQIIVIIGIMKDKDIRGILASISPVADTMILTKPKGERAATPDELNECLRSIGGIDSKIPLITPNVADALDTAKKIGKRDSIIIVTGSFYTTGEAKELLGHRAILSGLRE